MADWLHLSLRFLHYALLLGLFGWTAFRSLGLRKVALAPATDPRIAVLVCALLAPLFSAALMVVGIAEMMGQPLSMLDWASIEAMVLSTDMGWAFMVRFAMLSLAALVVVTNARRSMAATFYGVALLTFVWSGHAAATEGQLGQLHRLNDGVHLLAGGLWIGAIGWFLHLTIAAHRNPSVIALEPLLDTMHRFAPLGISLVAVVALTGLINAHLIFGLSNSAKILTTNYGWMLTAKISLVVLMLVCAAHNASIARHRDLTATNSAATTLAALRTSLFAEFMFAIAVVAMVAFFGLASPMA